MCGIGGILHANDRPVAAHALDVMRHALRHRGPDDAGSWREGRAGLCHTRLSVLDLSARAHQPMASSSGRCVLSFNGEIYNFRALRSELERAGRSFRSDGDSEVILHLFEESGLDGLDLLEGMFAFALFDRAEDRLILMRDRLGIKPLFWCHGPKGIAFASEPKALPRLAEFGAPSAERIAEYIAFRHASEAESLLPGVRTLLPGQRLLSDGRDVELERWWRAPEPGGGDPAKVPETIAQAVRRQLVSDVPVGVFLSGGVDSALVTAAAARALPQVDTFTVGFDEPDWDESQRSRVVSDALQTRPHVLRLEPEDYLADLGRALWHLDAPLNHAHSVHLLRLAAYSREHVTVALTGEGGDELFGGYPRYRLYRIARALRWAPSRLLEVVRSVASDRPRWGRILEAAARDGLAAAAINAAFVPTADAARLAGLERDEGVLAPRMRILEECRAQGNDDVTCLLALERRTYMVSLLQRMDRMSMAVGLECRVPLLDEGVYELAASLAPRDLLNFRATKIPLRRAAERLFGRRYANLPKSGFGVPLSDWLRGEGAFAAMACRVIEERRTRERGWVDTDLARRLLEQHRRGERDRSEEIWSLLNLELWARVCLDGDGPGAVAG